MKTLKKIIVLASLMLTVMLLAASEGVSAKSAANKKADKAYLKIVKKLAAKPDSSTKYSFADITGDGVHEGIIVFRGTDTYDMVYIYTMKNNKASKIFEFEASYLDTLKFYKNTKSLLLIQRGHSRHDERYYTLNNGKYELVAEAGGKYGDDESKTYPYIYSVIENGSEKEVTKKQYNKAVKAIAKKGKNVNLKTYEVPAANVTLKDGTFNGAFFVKSLWADKGENYRDNIGDYCTLTIKGNSAFISVERLAGFDFTYTLKNGTVTLISTEPTLELSGTVIDGFLELTFTKSEFMYISSGDVVIFKVA